MNVPVTSVALQLRSDMPTLLRDVALELKQRCGCAVHAFVGSEEQLRYFQSAGQREAYDSIHVQDYPLRAVDEALPNEDELVTRARKFEAKIGCTYNRLALGNRHLGRGFALLGPGHPRSRYSERTGYAHLLHGYNQLFEFWEAQFATHRINLVIGSSAELACIARAHQIPYRGLFGSRHRNLHFWGIDEYRSSDQVERRYHELSAEGAGGEAMEEPYDMAKKNHARMAAAVTLRSTLKTMALHTLRVAKWRATGHRKGRGYYYRDEMALMLRRWRDWRWLNGPAMKSLANLHGTPFILFPLQTEPETSIHQGSPEYFYQHAAIAALARDLPAGYVLAVKESPYGIGRRPPGFYSHVAALKNVVWLKADERGFDVVRQARAVATIVGTAGFEAAAMGKPVISFGRHNVYGFLPHVHLVEDEVNLQAALAQALSREFDHAIAELSGRRFLSAVIETSFDLGDYDYNRKTNHTSEAVAAAVTELLATLSNWGGSK
jgi:hypothetical protein